MKKKIALGLAAAMGLTASLMMTAAPSFAADLGVSDDFKPWMARLRGIYVVPDESTNLSLPGAEASVGNALVPELDFTYFFNENIAAELILGTTNHKVRGRGAIAGADLGDVWLLPPTLTLQYHFDATDSIKPYIGAGVNYTIFYGVDDGAMASVKYDNAFGAALQAGVDIAVNENWGLNLDVKKLFLKTNVRVDTGAGVIDGKVKLNPWIFGAGVSYRF